MSKVSIYAGHGISSNGVWDSGTVHKKYQEAKLVMPIVKSAVYYLEKSGVKVFSDYKKNHINMLAQVSEANANDVDLFVSVHLDYPLADSGTLPVYTSAEGRKLAECMNKSVMYYSSLNTRGLCRSNSLYELNATNMPACIFEVGCIKSDLSVIKHEYDFIGFGIAKGICNYLGIKFKPVQYTIVKKAKELEPKVVKHLKYDGKASNVTYGAALKGNKRVNGKTYISWILQRSDILNTHSNIYLGKDVYGNGAKQIKKKCTVLHPDAVWKKADLHVGDIVGYQWAGSKMHTMIVLRYNNGRPVFATCGSSDFKAKDLSRKRLAYENRKIKTICRVK